MVAAGAARSGGLGNGVEYFNFFHISISFIFQFFLVD
jgi:hypothetical protein